MSYIVRMRMIYSDKYIAAIQTKHHHEMMDLINHGYWGRISKEQWEINEKNHRNRDGDMYVEHRIYDGDKSYDVKLMFRLNKGYFLCCLKDEEDGFSQLEAKFFSPSPKRAKKIQILNDGTYM